MVAELVISSTLVPQKSLFTASSFCRPFFFGKERATAERKTGKGEGGFDREQTEQKRIKKIKPERLLSLLFSPFACSPSPSPANRSLSHKIARKLPVCPKNGDVRRFSKVWIVNPPSSRVLVQKDPSSPVADGSYRPICSSFRYAHAFLFAVLRVVYTMRWGDLCWYFTRNDVKQTLFVHFPRWWNNRSHGNGEGFFAHERFLLQTLSDNEAAVMGESWYYN